MSVNNLTGTTWIINTNFSGTWAQMGTYNINYKFGGIGYGSTVATATSFTLNGAGPPDEYPYMIDMSGVCTEMDGKTGIIPSDYVSTIEGYIVDPQTGEYNGTNIFMYNGQGSAPWSTGWTLSNHTMEIISGTDVTNSNLIAWLESNATQVQAVATVEYDGDILTSIPANTTVTFNTAGKLLTSSFTVTTGAGGGSATLIGKTITANGTYNASSDNADGYDQVTVNVAGPTYDTSDRAAQAQVLSGYYFYYPLTTATVTRRAGTMTNNGAVAQTLTVNGASYTIPAGYHNGSGHVYVNIPVYDGSVISVITDLTGTTWVFNESVNVDSILGYTDANYSINYTDGLNNSWDRLYLDNTKGLYITYIDDDGKSSESVYTGYWAAPGYKTVTFTGGTDVTSSQLIEILQANAVQQ